jgi:hypothetical protein
MNDTIHDPVSDRHAERKAAFDALPAAERLDRIAAWQATAHVHPLTCGTDSTHAELRGREIDGRVVLECLTCGRPQHYIPPLPARAALEAHGRELERLRLAQPS